MVATLKCPDFLLCQEKLPAQFFEDCLYHSLDRKATQAKNLDVPQDLC